MGRNSPKIKDLRVQKGLSMNELAKRTGFSKSYLSHIENLKREPTIGTLMKIARVLEVNVLSLLGGEPATDEDKSFVVVRSAERQTIVNPSNAGDAVYESITFKMKDRLMDGYIVTVNARFVEQPRAHEGHELAYILEGKQEFVYDGKSLMLEEGDCCYFDASKPHHARSIDGKGSKALVIFTVK